LQDLDVLVLDCLRFREHPTHLWVDRALEYIARIKPRRTFFTHIAHDIKHGRDSARLPPGVEFAHDGLVVEALPIADCQLPIEKGTGGS
jgi:phosphoribosyl 1,2-cyclic phosphate phosphodiesterase